MKMCTVCTCFAPCFGPLRTPVLGPVSIYFCICKRTRNCIREVHTVCTVCTCVHTPKHTCFTHVKSAFFRRSVELTVILWSGKGIKCRFGGLFFIKSYKFKKKIINFSKKIINFNEKIINFIKKL